MNTRLDQIKDWPERARLANYSASMLAKHCGVSLRTLERYFTKEIGESIKKWLAKQRQIRAAEVLKKFLRVKEAALHLGYKHTDHFSRDFKAHWGCCPTEMLVRPIANP